MATATAAGVFRKNATALITGAASGVGLAVAKLCASHAMHIYLIDKDAEKLVAAQEAVQRGGGGGGNVTVHPMDVSSLTAWKDLRSQVEADGQQLDFLHLNAGIGGTGDWTDAAYFHNIFDVNFFGVVHGINTFYPHFDDADASEQKAVVVTGSKQGITNPPGSPAYNASKAAVKAVAEHLHFDLAKSSPRTSVHLLVPGWTFTGLTGGGGLKEKPAGAWAPEQVADYLYQKMGEDKFYVMCPDNDVDWETDRKRMTWAMGDIVYERKPQSRWLDEFKDEANETMAGMKLGDKQSGSSS
jgi:NAD(P)-dependent dehydrogenase (short-subunit alcohol dehydrogenase family)